MKTLKVGDKVIWRGSWGKDNPKEATVIGIERTLIPGSKYGDQVDELDWDLVEEGYCIVNLDNEHWAYGYQLEPLKIEEKK